MISESVSLSAEPKVKATKRKIPAYLVRETIDGVNFYYPGFRQVLNKQKKLDEIMGDSGLQFFLKFYLAELLNKDLDKQLYRVAGGELGFHASLKNNMGLDVVIFDRAVLTPDKITPRYVSVAPKVVIEIDVNVELPDRTSDLFQEYVIRKVDSLFKHGVEKVIWFFSKSKKVFIALPGQAWQIDDWNQDVELFEGVKVNVADFIAQEGFKLE
ncbi:hypothetical protein [Haliscomenobacter hydrossis]|uniref:Restriction endonuclease domain-containing protein n=1 Tax=Haliscomenobacter hydrossis (strain ATCC 27775 / DSM 1100 / LMG 10767 / O) TaxID=760192 RepID=F4KZR8_HALH1|nr:hypothetical protein [Haliscomenobacter hydrossis]AEE50504.1 hypothetical protein Halhy_2635 [Haliscomenobacter hydrossis DSM 1100]